MLAVAPCHASSYYMGTGGSDGNAGTSGSPWASPNHALNCGDVIIASPGTYSASNTGSGKWGTVTCPSANNVAWLQCATFDACYVTATGSDAIRVDKSYWGVSGWEASTNTTQSGACFAAAADSATTIHHIIFANDVANGCMGGGFTSYNYSTTVGVDYIIVVGNVAYNAAQGNTHCFSGVSIYQPVASDANSGTHMYVAGNYIYHNVEPSTCNGTAPTDGEAVILDTFDFSQGGGTAYTQQAVVQNNIGVFNGGHGFEVFNNATGGTQAPIYVKYNTSVSNVQDNNQTAGCLGRAELRVAHTKTTTYDHNLAQTRTGTSCSSGAIYGVFVETVDGTDAVTNSWIYSAAGNTSGTDNATGFSFGSITSTTPSFSSITSPSAPSCSGTGNVPACMATVISNFTPSTSGASNYGYQAVSTTSISDALFPAWLCTGHALDSGFPSGVVTPGCGVVTATYGSQLNISGTLHGTLQ